MSFGQILLVLAMISGIGGTIAAIPRLRRIAWMPARAAYWGWLGAAVFAWTSFLWLLLQFVNVNVVYEYVFLYTSDAMPLRYRLAGAWTGREGSLLLWTAYMATAAAILLKRRGDDARQWTGLFLGLIGSAFLIAVATQGLYRPTPEFFLQGRPTGNGLNPLLKSPFIIIHPPLMFLAYALTTVTAAAGLGSIVTGTNAWSRIGQTWARINWFVYTAAIGLGGIWAYYTLGFGGYWAWDPVEVANLLPWLVLTAFMHTQSANLRHGDFRLAGPMMAILPFFLTLFSAISTRSGLWFSVHAFTDPTNTFNPDAAGRFLRILDAEPLVAFFTAMSIGVLLFGLAAWTRRASIDLGTAPRLSWVSGVLIAALAAWALTDIQSFLAGSFELSNLVARGNVAIGMLALAFGVVLLATAPLFLQRGEEETRHGGLTWLNERNLVQLSALLLACGTMVLFLFHMQAVNGWNRAFYDARFPWLMAPVIATLMAFFLTPQFGRKKALAITVSAFLIALMLAWLVSTTAYLVLLATALLAAALIDLVHTCAPSAPKQRIAGALLLVAALLNLMFWINPPTVRLGFTWQPIWPTQLIMGAVALYVLVQVHRILAGRDVRRPGHVYLLAALMGAYYIAPVLVAAAWYLRDPSRQAAKTSVADVRMRRAAIHGLHFVVALGLLAFTLSTYLADEQTVTLGSNESATIGGASITYLDSSQTLQTGTPWVETITPNFDVDQDTPATGYLYWEPQKDHYDPLPIATRQWMRDVYIDVQAVCIDSTGDCGEAGDWIQQHGKAGQRITGTQEVTAVEARIISLPAVGLVWAAWILGVAYSGVLVVTSMMARREP